MAIINQPIEPKDNRIIDIRFRDQYSFDNANCEYCWSVLREWNTHYLELHHIRSGLYRHDTIENVIVLCRRHHEMATTHKNGESAVRFNEILIEIKKKKGEIK